VTVDDCQVTLTGGGGGAAMIDGAC
jgi:hypothetical protein